MGRERFELPFESKLALLRLVSERKEVLFGSFSQTVTAKSKQESWDEIMKKCKLMGIPLPYEKGCAYLRDTVWNNLKKRTMVMN